MKQSLQHKKNSRNESPQTYVLNIDMSKYSANILYNENKVVVRIDKIFYKKL